MRRLSANLLCSSDRVRRAPSPQHPTGQSLKLLASWSRSFSAGKFSVRCDGKSSMREILMADAAMGAADRALRVRERESSCVVLYGTGHENPGGQSKRGSWD